VDKGNEAMRKGGHRGGERRKRKEGNKRKREGEEGEIDGEEFGGRKGAGGGMAAHIEKPEKRGGRYRYREYGGRER